MLTKIFGHIALGDTPQVLEAIRTDLSVNGALLRQSTAPALRSYLQGLTSGDIGLERTPEDGDPYGSVKGFFAFRAGETTVEDIRAELAKGFPVKNGFEDFARDVWSTLADYCAATGYQEIDGAFVASLPCAAGCWHHDNDTDVRGFKAYIGPGPFLRANDTIEKWRVVPDFYGMPDETPLPEGTVTRLEEGDFGIWRGDCHEKPLIHVKPAVRQGELRLSLLINPTEENYLKMLDRKGLQRFYTAPSV